MKTKDKKYKHKKAKYIWVEIDGDDDGTYMNFVDSQDAVFFKFYKNYKVITKQDLDNDCYLPPGYYLIRLH